MIVEPVTRILIVDDEAAVRRSLAMFLEDAGFQVAVADQAEEALANAVAGCCQLAIVDLRLPGLSGDSLILKLHERYPHLRFLIFTGSPAYELPAKLAAVGMSQADILLKPLLDLDLLLDAIQRTLHPNREAL